ncbi:hypothetical protein ACFX13_014478 [Malus domestica]
MDPEIHKLLPRRASALRPSHIDREMDSESHELLSRRASALRPSHIDREMDPEIHKLLPRRASALRPSHIGNSESSTLCTNLFFVIELLNNISSSCILD